MIFVNLSEEYGNPENIKFDESLIKSRGNFFWNLLL